MVIGAGASSVVDDAVAIGSGSTATLSQAAAQAAFTGTTIGAVSLTEGTNAVGGEANFGDRLTTGVADARIAAGSSDAVNGHQLFQVTTDLDGRVTANTAGILVNTGATAANSAGILANTSNITTNTGNITANTTGIGTNATNIAGNTTAITANTAGIGTNANNITTNANNITANGTAITTNTNNITTLSLIHI